MLQPRELRVLMQRGCENYFKTPATAASNETAKITATAFLSASKSQNLLLITLISLFLLLPIGLTENVDNSYLVEVTPALRSGKEDLTTVLLVKNDNANRRNDYLHGRYLNVRPEVGLLTSTARTFIQEGVTTEYATQVVGTTLDNGRLYAQFLKKSSRVLYDNEPLLYNEQLTNPSVHTSWVGESNLIAAVAAVTVGSGGATAVLPQSHNDLLNAEQPDWQDIDDSLLLERNEFVENTDFVGLNELNSKYTVTTVVAQSFVASSASSSSSSSSGSSNDGTTAKLKFLPLNIIGRSAYFEENARKLAIDKVLPIGDLPTYTVKNHFAPSGYSWDNNANNALVAAAGANGGTREYNFNDRSPKLYYEQLMEEEVEGANVRPAATLPMRSRILSTTTYYGFADFTTMVGDSVIVFSPSTSTSMANLGHVTSIKGEATLGGDNNVKVTKVAITITEDLIVPTHTQQQHNVLPTTLVKGSGVETVGIIYEDKEDEEATTVFNAAFDAETTVSNVENANANVNIENSNRNAIYLETSEVSLPTDVHTLQMSSETLQQDSSKAIMYSRPSDQEILAIYASLSRAEEDRKSSAAASEELSIVSSHQQTAEKKSSNIELLAKASTATTSAAATTQQHSHGGATTIFFEDDPFANFVEPTAAIKFERNDALPATSAVAIDAVVAARTDNSVDAETTTVEATTEQSDDNDNSTTKESSKAKESTAEVTSTSESFGAAGEQLGIVIKEINDVDDLNCIHTSQAFLTQLSKTLTYFTTFYDTNSDTATKTSIETNLVQTFEISQTFKHYCLQPTSVIQTATAATTIATPTVNVNGAQQVEKPDTSTTTTTKKIHDNDGGDDGKQHLTTTTLRQGERDDEANLAIEATTKYNGTTEKDNQYDGDDTDIVDSTEIDSGEEEIDLIHKTLYTTYTYLTTFFHEETTSVSSHTEVVTNIITSTVGVTAADDLFKATEISPVSTTVTRLDATSSKFVVPTELENIIRDGETSDNSEVNEEETVIVPSSESNPKATAYLDDSKVTKTYYTTYTYYTTIFADAETEIMSRTEVYTNLVAGSITPTKILDETFIMPTASIEQQNAAAKVSELEEEEEREPDIITASISDEENVVLDDENVIRKSIGDNNHQYSTMIRSSTSTSSATQELSDFNDAITLVTDVCSSSSNGDHHIISNREQLVDDQISSESNNDDEIIPSATLLLQTSFTTFTYYTTMYSGDNTNVISRLETVTNVVTETLQPTKTTRNIEEATLPITYFTTFTYWTKLAKNGDITTLSREETISNVVTPIVIKKATTINNNNDEYPTKTTREAMIQATANIENETTSTTIANIDNETLITAVSAASNVLASSSDISHDNVNAIGASKTIVTTAEAITTSLEPTTFYTTYTYYTTSYETDKTIIDSRFETITNIVTPTITINDTAVATSAAAMQDSANDATAANSDTAAATPDTAVKANDRNILLYDFKKIIDSDGISTLFFTTQIFPTIDADGLASEIVSSTSSLYIDEEKKTFLPTTTTVTVNTDGSTTSVRQYKTGLVRLIEGTRIGNHTTTLYQSKVIGTFIESRYAQIIESTSSFLFKKTKLAESSISPSTTLSNHIEATQQTALNLNNPSVVQSSIHESGSDGDRDADDHAEAAEQDEEGGDDDENGDANEGVRGTFQLKKRTFTPVIRPFASRNRPQFAPKKKNGAPSSATIITRSDFTPTITATPALKSTGRFSSSRKSVIAGGGTSSAPIGALGNSPSRRFGRPNKAAVGGLSVSGASGGTGVGGFGSARGRLPSSSRITPVSSSRRGGGSLARSSSSGGGFRAGFSSAYAGNSRFRIKPTASLGNLGDQQSNSATDGAFTTLAPDASGEEENSTQQQANPEEDEESATENSRRNQNPLLRFRRPINRPAGFIPAGQRVSSASNNPVSPRRNPLPVRAKTTSTSTTTTTTTSRPRPRNFQRPTLSSFQNRLRPQNNLFPPRGLFQKQGAESKEKKKEGEEVNDGTEADDDSEYDDDDEEGEDDGDDDVNRRRRSNGKQQGSKTKGNLETNVKIPITSITSKRSQRQRREAADTSYQTRSNFRNRFRRPTQQKSVANERSYDEVEVETSPTPTTPRSRTGSRFNSRYTHANSHHSTTIAAVATSTTNHRAIRPTRPTSGRAQFTLRDKDTTTSTQKGLTRAGISNFRRPQTAASSRRSSATSTASSRRLKSYASNNLASDSSSRNSATRSRNGNIGSGTGRTRGGSSVRGRIRNEYNSDAVIAPFDGTITVTHVIPAGVTIPVVNGKVTEYKNVVTAKTSTEVLSPQHYTRFVASKGNTQLALVREESSVNYAGATEITRFVLLESLTTTVTFTPTTIRGRKTSFSHVIPSTVYSVENVVSTVQPQIGANAPLANILLSQLLLGNIGLPSNPLLGALSGGITQAPIGALPGGLGGGAQQLAQPATPVTEFRTHTSTYATTLFEGGYTTTATIRTMKSISKSNNDNDVDSFSEELYKTNDIAPTFTRKTITNTLIDENANIDVVSDEARNEYEHAGMNMDEPRYNLATRIMSNGVEVIIASDKSRIGDNVVGAAAAADHAQKSSLLRIVPSQVYKPMTLAPSTLKNQMILMMPTNIQENFTIPVKPDQFITKTCLTTYTYRTTYLQDGKTTVESREKVISNIATEERNYLKISPALSLGVTLTSTPELAIGLFPTTYSYYNTILDGELPLVVTSKHIVVNTITGPDYYIAFLQPSEEATPVYDTNTYYSKLTLTKTISDADIQKIVTTSNVLTQVIVTESLPAHSTSVLTSYYALDGGNADYDDEEHHIKEPTLASRSAVLQVQPPIINIANAIATDTILKTKFITFTYLHTYADSIGKKQTETSLKITQNIVTEHMLHKNPQGKATTSSLTRNKLATTTEYDVHIYATKTFLTTFTYFTTSLVSSTNDKIAAALSPTIAALATNQKQQKLKPQSLVKADKTLTAATLTSTIVNYHTRIIENVITESVHSLLLRPELLTKFRTELKKGKNQRRVIVTMATLLGGQTLEITAMKMLKPTLHSSSKSTEINKGTTMTKKAAVTVAKSTSNNGAALKHKTSAILNNFAQSTAVYNVSVQDEVVEQQQQIDDDNAVKEGEEEEGEEEDSNAAGSQQGQIYVLAPPLSSSSSPQTTNVKVKPINNNEINATKLKVANQQHPNPSNSAIPVTVNQLIDSLNLNRLNALRPVFNAMAGLLKNNFAAPTTNYNKDHLQQHQQHQTQQLHLKHQLPINNAVQSKHNQKNTSASNNYEDAVADGPIYIPVKSALDDKKYQQVVVYAAASNIDESVAVNGNINDDSSITFNPLQLSVQSLHIQPPEVDVLISDDNWLLKTTNKDISVNKNGQHGQLQQYEATAALINGGIPIRPGEVITANSDLIIGKPNGILYPRMPFNNQVPPASQKQHIASASNPPPATQTSLYNYFIQHPTSYKSTKAATQSNSHSSTTNGSYLNVIPLLEQQQEKLSSIESYHHQLHLNRHPLHHHHHNVHLHQQFKQNYDNILKPPPLQANNYLDTKMIQIMQNQANQKKQQSTPQNIFMLPPPSPPTSPLTSYLPNNQLNNQPAQSPLQQKQQQHMNVMPLLTQQLSHQQPPLKTYNINSQLENHNEVLEIKRIPQVFSTDLPPVVNYLNIIVPTAEIATKQQLSHYINKDNNDYDYNDSYNSNDKYKLAYVPAPGAKQQQQQPYTYNNIKTNAAATKPLKQHNNNMNNRPIINQQQHQQQQHEVQQNYHQHQQKFIPNYDRDRDSFPHTFSIAKNPLLITNDINDKKNHNKSPSQTAAGTAVPAQSIPHQHTNHQHINLNTNVLNHNIDINVPPLTFKKEYDYPHEHSTAIHGQINVVDSNSNNTIVSGDRVNGAGASVAAINVSNMPQIKIPINGREVQVNLTSQNVIGGIEAPLPILIAHNNNNNYGTTDQRILSEQQQDHHQQQQYSQQQQMYGIINDEEASAIGSFAVQDIIMRMPDSLYKKQRKNQPQQQQYVPHLNGVFYKKEPQQNKYYQTFPNHPLQHQQQQHQLIKHNYNNNNNINNDKNGAANYFMTTLNIVDNPLLTTNEFHRILPPPSISSPTELVASLSLKNNKIEKQRPKVTLTSKPDTENYTSSVFNLLNISPSLPSPSQQYITNDNTNYKYTNYANNNLEKDISMWPSSSVSAKVTAASNTTAATWHTIDEVVAADEGDDDAGDKKASININNDQKTAPSTNNFRMPQQKKQYHWQQQQHNNILQQFLTPIGAIDVNEMHDLPTNKTRTTATKTKTVVVSPTIATTTTTTNTTKTSTNTKLKLSPGAPLMSSPKIPQQQQQQNKQVFIAAGEGFKHLTIATATIVQTTNKSIIDNNEASPTTAKTTTPSSASSFYTPSTSARTTDEIFQFHETNYQTQHTYVAAAANNSNNNYISNKNNYEISKYNIPAAASAPATTTFSTVPTKTRNKMTQVYQQQQQQPYVGIRPFPAPTAVEPSSSSSLSSIASFFETPITTETVLGLNPPPPPTVAAPSLSSATSSSSYSAFVPTATTKIPYKTINYTMVKRLPILPQQQSPALSSQQRQQEEKQQQQLSVTGNSKTSILKHNKQQQVEIGLLSPPPPLPPSKHLLHIIPQKNIYSSNSYTQQQQQSNHQKKLNFLKPTGSTVVIFPTTVISTPFAVSTSLRFNATLETLSTADNADIVDSTQMTQQYNHHNQYPHQQIQSINNYHRHTVETLEPSETILQQRQQQKPIAFHTQTVAPETTQKYHHHKNQYRNNGGFHHHQQQQQQHHNLNSSSRINTKLLEQYPTAAVPTSSSISLTTLKQRIILPTKYIINTQLLTVTTTKTAIFNANNDGSEQQTKTLLLTKTQTATVVDIITETHSLLQPTRVTESHYIVATTTATTTETTTIHPTIVAVASAAATTDTTLETATATIENVDNQRPYLYNHKPYQNEVSGNDKFDPNDDLYDTNKAHSSIEVVLSDIIADKKQEIQQQQQHEQNAPNTEASNDSIFIVMTNNKNIARNNNNKGNIATITTDTTAAATATTAGGAGIEIDYNDNGDVDDGLTFNLPTRDEESISNDAAKTNSMLLGGVLIATPPKSNGSPFNFDDILIRQAENSNPTLNSAVGSESTLATIGDATCHPSCKSSRNEICAIVDSRSRCVCRPGFARMFPDRPCKPTYTYAMRIHTHRFRNHQLHYDPPLARNNSDDFRHLAGITHDGVHRMVMQSDYRDVYHGVHLTSFGTDDYKTNKNVFANFLLQLSDNTDENRLETVFKKYLRMNNYSIGGTELFTSKHGAKTLSVVDFNECAHSQFHDCSKNARCFNLPGTYTCSCREGYVDLSENAIYPGRLCSGEMIGCDKCHYHGKCVMVPHKSTSSHTNNTIDGQQQQTTHDMICECFAWHTGASCQLNLKILLIALIAIGLLLFILLLFCILLTVTKRRKRRQGHALSSTFAGIHKIATKNTRITAAISSAAGSGVTGRGGGKNINIDKHAMIKDSSSETSQNSLPYILKKESTASPKKSYHSNNTSNTFKNNYRAISNHQKQQQQQPTSPKLQIASTSLTYDPIIVNSLTGANNSSNVIMLPTSLTHSFNELEHDYPEQADRSLTVMIPRAKYHHPSVLPQTQLMHHQLTMERAEKQHHQNKSEPMTITPAHLGVNAGNCNDMTPSAQQINKKLSESSLKMCGMSSTTPGALVSAGFEVSAIVSGNLLSSSSGALSYSTNDGSGLHNMFNTNAVGGGAADAYASGGSIHEEKIYSNFISGESLNAHRNKLNLTEGPDSEYNPYKCDKVSTEARSFDETTVQATTKCMHICFESQTTTMNDEVNTMAERDIGSTYLLPHTHLYKPERQESDISGFDSF